MNLDNDSFLDSLQQTCCNALDNKSYNKRVKKIILDLGAKLFVLQCYKAKYKSIKR